MKNGESFSRNQESGMCRKGLQLRRFESYSRKKPGKKKGLNAGKGLALVFLRKNSRGGGVHGKSRPGGKRIWQK